MKLNPERGSDVDISVVMSVFNEPKKWLEASIYSILNQTYDNFEFIIINDNPESEEHASLLKHFAEKDNRIKISFNKKNIGLTRSLNKGVKLAIGKYIARMDADDISVPSRFSKQISFLKSNPDYIACGTNIIMVDDECKKEKLLKKPMTNEDVKSFLFIESPIVHPTLFYRKENDLNLEFNPTYKYSQDYDFISQLALHGKLRNIQEPLLYYRVSSSQISSKKLSEQNDYANQIRSKNISAYLKKNYNVSFGDMRDKDNIRHAQTVTKLIQCKKYDKKNLSAILYSILFYSSGKSIKKNYFIVKSQPQYDLSIKYRLRLLLSMIITFNDQSNQMILK